MASRSTKMMSVWFAVLAGLALTACGENTYDGNGGAGATTPVPEEPTAEGPRLDEPSVSPTPSSPTPTSTPGEETPRPAGGTRLKIIVVEGPGVAPRTWELTCDPVGGTHPDPAVACAAIISASEHGDPFAPVPPDTFCMQIYAGPQRAIVKGTWRGAEVSATFSRENGCEIERWDKLWAVFQTPLSPTRG